MKTALVASLRRAVATVLPCMVAKASAQQPATTGSLVFDGVTVVDVAQGKLVSNRRVVVRDHRIQAIGGRGTVKLPPGARVVNARGQYLIPGLWDMHFHTEGDSLEYPALIMAGVTGIRDPGSAPPLDTLLRWRREILAEARVGPPRQSFSGKTINSEQPDCKPREHATYRLAICITTAAEARQLVDSLQAAGADMVKPRHVSAEIYFAIAAEARRLGIPFGGHADHVTALEASDSGASIIDHIPFHDDEHGVDGTIGVGPHPEPCLARRPSDTVERCRRVAEHLRRHGTWWVPTLVQHHLIGDVNGTLVQPRLRFNSAVMDHFQRLKEFYGLDLGIPSRGPDTLPVGQGLLSLAQETGLPILAGTDEHFLYGLQLELTLLAGEGLPPLVVLQAATLNPAKFLHATDSLGTVAPGKLADLVLLDADPLADITNTLRIRAVVANGRYYDRATLDQIRAKVWAAMRPKNP